MGLDEYVESDCENCGSALTQLDGDWFCPECGNDAEFHLVPDSSDFVV